MSSVIHIHRLDVYERMKRGQRLQIIDVRKPGEVAAGKIPGAKNIPLGQIPMRMSEIDPSQDTVMICRSGSRSAMACEFLMAAGFTRVKNMLGGMNAWTWEVE
ncbi:rhodanese-like domain-containing protein [Alicyclobacillus macrosporangiidus]|uniref:rhodanese-like domain-containing protein n=1 Tax=Alicyclobacillus macrosporangiidus TaxID=392015 RepID=UPI000497BEF2